jgi:hypothetical protein
VGIRPEHDYDGFCWYGWFVLSLALLLLIFYWSTLGVAPCLTKVNVSLVVCPPKRGEALLLLLILVTVV